MAEYNTPVVFLLPQGRKEIKCRLSVYWDAKAWFRVLLIINRLKIINGLLRV